MSTLLTLAVTAPPASSRQKTDIPTATGFVTAISPLPCGRRPAEPFSQYCNTARFLFPQPARYDSDRMVVALVDVSGARRWFDERLIAVDTGTSGIGIIDTVTRQDKKP